MTKINKSNVMRDHYSRLTVAEFNALVDWLKRRHWQPIPTCGGKETLRLWKKSARGNKNTAPLVFYLDEGQYIAGGLASEQYKIFRVSEGAPKSKMNLKYDRTDPLAGRFKAKGT